MIFYPFFFLHITAKNMCLYCTHVFLASALFWQEAVTDLLVSSFMLWNSSDTSYSSGTLYIDREISVRSCYNSLLLLLSSSARKLRNEKIESLLNNNGFLVRLSSVVVTRRHARDGDIVPDIPSTHEMEEFFADAEREQQMLFIQKYTPLHLFYSFHNED